MVKRLFDEYVTWKEIAVLVAILLTVVGLTFDTANDARVCAQETREILAKDYVPKDQYRIDIENLNKKMDFITEMLLKANAKK